MIRHRICDRDQLASSAHSKLLITSRRNRRLPRRAPGLFRFTGVSVSPDFTRVVGSSNSGRDAPLRRPLLPKHRRFGETSPPDLV